MHRDERGARSGVRRRRQGDGCRRIRRIRRTSGCRRSPGYGGRFGQRQRRRGRERSGTGKRWGERGRWGPGFRRLPRPRREASGERRVLRGMPVRTGLSSSLRGRGRRLHQHRVEVQRALSLQPQHPLPGGRLLSATGRAWMDLRADPGRPARGTVRHPVHDERRLPRFQGNDAFSVRVQPRGQRHRRGEDLPILSLVSAPS
jgi:hypothetical protein